MAKEKAAVSTRDVLGSAGRRVTAQRMLLLDLIRESEGHLDADELYRRARIRDPRLSLSTVYRTLSLLKSLGFVEELHLDEEHHHYELKPSEEHYHFVCLSCGNVCEFESPHVSEMKQALEKSEGFNVTSTTLELTGYCRGCSKKKEIK